MSQSEHNFSVWLFRPRGWDGRKPGERVAFPFAEPAEAADQAEAVLRQNGEIGQSYCELRFNGDTKPHTVICYLGENRFGIWNTEVVRWPIFYAEAGGSDMLADFPFEIEDDGNSWQEKDDADSKMKSDDGVMRLDDIEDVDDTEEEEEFQDDSDEGAEDEALSEDDEAEEDFISEDDDGDIEAEEEDSQDDDESGTDEDDESDEDESGEDDEDDEQDGDEEDFNGDEDSEEGDSEPDLDNDEEEEEEFEMPRLRIFAKFRGPLGWRKRAEAEELETTNRFALKLGVLDPEAEKTAQQERETFLEMVFIESDESRTAGELRLKLPEGIEWSEPTKAGWISATIPYPREDEDNGN